MDNVKKWNVVFLTDADPAKHITLLQRSPNKSYAPGFCTGIGGKIGDIPGFEAETPLESAYRELLEETEGELTQENVTLHEFARTIYEDGRIVYYFYGIYKGNDLPHVDQKDGVLVRVPVSELLDRKFIPTAKAVCEEWSRRNFATNAPFTIYVKELGIERTVNLIEILKIEEGLQEA